nr:putative cuticle collagen 91 [Chlorocebus sabaeus]
MLRSPLPAAAASHTASHVSLPLFFFFLTSARGGAATARPLTSPLLARPRPGWGEGEGAAPARARPPGPGGLPAAAGRGGWQRRRRTEGEGRERSEPASRVLNPARPPRRGARVGASTAPVPGGLGAGAQSGDSGTARLLQPAGSSFLPASPPHRLG